MERGGGRGRREKTSLVREEYEMEQEEKYIYKKKTKKNTELKWWWLGNTLNQLVIPAQEVGGTWGTKSTSLNNGRDSPGLNRKK